MEMSQVLTETKADISWLKYVMLTNMQRSVRDYVVPIRKQRDKLLFESKFVGIEYEKDFAQGDAYKSIKEVRVDAISRELSKEVPREIPRAISGTTFEAILHVKIEIELRKVEENVQQFRAEWEKYSRVQWHSEKNKS